MVHPGARDVLTWAVERDSATVSEANAATEVVMLLDTLRLLADQLYTMLAFTQTLGLFDDWKSKRIAQGNPFSWTCQAGRAARSSGTTGGLDEALHAKKRRTVWSAPHVGRRHQDGGVGSASS